MNTLKIQLLLCLFFLCSLVTKADPTITSFTPQALTNGKILVSQTVATSVTFSVGISRPLIPGTNGYEGEGITLTIVYSSGSTEENISGGLFVGTSDFNGLANVSKTYNLSIPAGKVGGYIKLKYSYATPQGGYSQNNYANSIFQTTDVAPPPPTGYPLAIDGSFTRYTGDGAIYICIQGVWQHILTLPTLEGIFDNPPITNSGTPPPFGFTGTVIGDPIGPESQLLVNNAEGGKVYFRTGNTVRWIINMQKKVKYHFNWNSLTYVNNINGYTVGPQIE